MNVMVHFPETPGGMQDLQKQAAALYAQAVISQIQKLSCPTEQKIDLMKEIERARKRPAKSNKGGLID